MRSRPSRFRTFRARLLTAAVVLVSAWAPAAHASWCGDGLWIDAMIGSHHLHPDKDFKQFNPGIGVECWVAPQWALTGGYFRNSLSKPSFYGGGVWAPEFLHWHFIRLAAMGGLISGYDYGSWGIGHNHTVGPVAAPLIMLDYKRVGANIILIPPIPSNDLPFTIGFMLRVKF
ncbi:hypothetical protein [Caballeronia ptereochthonis]|uniref:Lipid A palmitoyltransferase PagP n=1 Tax=Caballeronia ptereochthonis TaxID=1777144 RepID=A0A158DUX6_9BURK|nr:hypothetical protein [Caballeronia ptereochthonis]SAK97996.1 hypothetical protein AWB83_05866 [Caballeronia ptereochthonis]